MDQKLWQYLSISHTVSESPSGLRRLAYRPVGAPRFATYYIIAILYIICQAKSFRRKKRGWKIRGEIKSVLLWINPDFQILMPKNPVDHWKELPSGKSRSPPRRATRRRWFWSFWWRKAGEDFLRFFPSTRGAGQMVSPFIDLLDLLKNLSTFSTEIFVNRHFLLLFIKHTHGAWSIGFFCLIH